jgi:c-di-GMP-binding flagellar brake protein YcgR
MSQPQTTDTSKTEAIELSLERAGSGAERRQHERIGIPQEARITVWDASGAPVGSVCQLSRGGMRIRVFPGEDWLRQGEDYVFIMKNAAQDRCFSAWIVVRNFDGREAGCEFQNMDMDVAVQVGEIMGVYYDEHLQQMRTLETPTDTAH